MGGILNLGMGLALSLPLDSLTTLWVSVDLSASLFPVCEVGRLEWGIPGIA